MLTKGLKPGWIISDHLYVWVKWVSLFYRSDLNHNICAHNVGGRTLIGNVCGAVYRHIWELARALCMSC